MKTVIIAVLFIASVFGDYYMHNPRGSNNRHREANTNANNQNRLFDSQNNAKGGYCWGPALSFYQGSLLPIQWTNQHGCNQDKLVCNLVIQYMCSAAQDHPTVQVRDGATSVGANTNTITANAQGATTTTTGDSTGELLYGMHEPYINYLSCSTRLGNGGLYVADRIKEGNLAQPANRRATATRQNNNANRYGYECQEERDYYPYWHPSPWVDVAIMVDATLQANPGCAYFQAESQNVKAKNICQTPTGGVTQYNNAGDCTTNGNTWVSVPAWGIAAPDCQLAAFSKDNSLGNGAGTDNNQYMWTVPTLPGGNSTLNENATCVLRVRYNISTIEIGWNVDWTANGQNSLLYQDPTVTIADDDTVGDTSTQTSLNVTLALDTSQYARTFQDRSLVFHITSRPTGIPNTALIYNINVRGKRGNIVQTYPATEYDFVPNDLQTRQGDYIHFQWTGCDTNPAGNAGEGTDQTDRHNLVQLSSLGVTKPLTNSQINSGTAALFTDKAARARMAMIDQTGCESEEELYANNANNANNVEQALANCGKLNAAPQSFNGGAFKMNNTGVFHFASSRNNNFSNRGQKAQLTIYPLLPSWAIGIIAACAAITGLAGVVGAGMFYAKTHPHSMLAEKLAAFEK